MNQPSSPQPQGFTADELRKCVEREVAMRKSCYPRWDKVTSVDALSPARKKELAMMQAVAERLSLQPPILNEGQLELLRDNADFCNTRTRELLDRLLADYDRLRNL